MALGRNEYRKFDRQMKHKKVPKKAILITVYVILGVIIALFAAYQIVKASGKNGLKKDVDEEKFTEAIVQEEHTEELEDGVISYNGTKYKYNEDLVTILCMGVDTSANNVKKNISGNNGQADAIFLIVFNEQEKTVKLINVPRDIIAGVAEYDKNGQFYKEIQEQIALQFAYGDGKEKSCELMKSIVSEVMYGLPINAYASINLDAIGVLNNQVGGVTLTMEEDLTKTNPAFKTGATIKLDGNQANQFVRARDTNTMGSNLQRIGRQKQYLVAFTQTAVPAVKEDMTLPLTMYQAIERYMTTDIKADEVTYLAEQAVNSQIDIENIQILPGEYRAGEKYDEYVLDDDALYEMILQNFYTKVE